jgi:hypothetical protein
MGRKRKPAVDDPDQYARFVETAKRVQDEGAEERFEETVKRVLAVKRKKFKRPTESSG